MSDGETSLQESIICFIENAVQANNSGGDGLMRLRKEWVYNVAVGDRTTLKYSVQFAEEALAENGVVYEENRRSTVDFSFWRWRRILRQISAKRAITRVMRRTTVISEGIAKADEPWYLCATNSDITR